MELCLAQGLIVAIRVHGLSLTDWFTNCLKYNNSHYTYST